LQRFAIDGGERKREYAQHGSERAKGISEVAVKVPGSESKYFMKTTLFITLAAAAMIASLRAQTNLPSVVCPDPVTAECAGSNGTPVSLTVLVSPAGSNALSVVWSVDGASYQTNDVAGGGTNSAPVAVDFTATFGFGSHDVAITVTDSQTNTVTCTNTVDVVDTTPPVISDLKATPSTLWPPDHTMRCVKLTLAASDTCGGSVTSRVVSVTSNEAQRGNGDGNTCPDWALVEGKMKVYLRAERSGRGHGRVYTITVETTDASGNASTATVNVCVPHDQGHKVVVPPPKPKPQKPTKESKKGKGPKK
jgi:hypothetical protein